MRRSPYSLLPLGLGLTFALACAGGDSKPDDTAETGAESDADADSDADSDVDTTLTYAEETLEPCGSNNNGDPITDSWNVTAGPGGLLLFFDTPDENTAAALEVGYADGSSGGGASTECTFDNPVGQDCPVAVMEEGRYELLVWSFNGGCTNPSRASYSISADGEGYFTQGDWDDHPNSDR